MSDSFEFTLHNPLSKEDWDKLTDVELEKTDHIWFETPSGKRVNYISANVFNKIRAEIEELDGKYVIGDYGIYGKNIPKYVKLMEVLQIIGKYMTEGEVSK